MNEENQQHLHAHTCTFVPRGTMISLILAKFYPSIFIECIEYDHHAHNMQRQQGTRDRILIEHDLLFYIWR